MVYRKCAGVVVFGGGNEKRGGFGEHTNLCRTTRESSRPAPNATKLSGHFNCRNARIRDLTPNSFARRREPHAKAAAGSLHCCCCRFLAWGHLLLVALSSCGSQGQESRDGSTRSVMYGAWTSTPVSLSLFPVRGGCRKLASPRNMGAPGSYNFQILYLPF